MLHEFSFYDVIEKIRVRPGMYIGDSSPNSLRVFLDGYGLAMHEAGVEDASHPRLQGFHDWIASKLGFCESTAGWANMILATTMGLDPAHVAWDDIHASATSQQRAEATTRVFALLDEFRREAAH
jgi:hypothetical protein